VDPVPDPLLFFFKEKVLGVNEVSSMPIVVPILC
jgi:hypothetical protein